MAAAFIGNVNVKISAVSGAFTSGMRRAAAGVGILRKGIGTLGGALGSLKAALAGVVGIGALGLMVQQSLKSTDALGKVADQLRLTTEQLAAFRHAATLSGLKSQEFIEKGLLRMQKSIGDAQDGLSTAVRGFERLGLTWQDLVSLSPADQFALIRDRMNAVHDQTTRISAGFAIFGKVGIPLLNTMRQDFGAIEKQVAQFGTALHRIDVAQVERANDQMANVKEAIKGVVDNFTVLLAPAIAEVALRIQDFIKRAGGGAAVASKAFGKMLSIVGAFAKAWDIAGAALHAFGVAVAVPLALVTKLAIVALEAARSLGELVGFEFGSDLADSLDRIDTNLANNIGDSVGQIGDVISGKFKTEDAINQFFREAQAGAVAFAETVQLDGGPIAALDDLGEAAEEADRKLKSLETAAARIFEATRTPLEKYTAQMDQLFELIERGLITMDTYKRAALDAFDTMREATETTVEKVKSLGKALATTSVRTVQALVGGTAEAFRAEVGSGGQVLENIQREALLELRELRRTNHRLVAKLNEMLQGRKTAVIG